MKIEVIPRVEYSSRAEFSECLAISSKTKGNTSAPVEKYMVPRTDRRLTASKPPNKSGW